MKIIVTGKNGTNNWIYEKEEMHFHNGVAVGGRVSFPFSA